MSLFQLIYYGFSTIQSYQEGVSKLNSLLLLEFPSSSPITKQNLIFKNISFENISYSYPKTSRNVINNISLEFNAGDKIGVYGQSGSGKSTFINIIMTLLVPTEGQIKVNSKILDPKKKENFFQP